MQSESDGASPYLLVDGLHLEVEQLGKYDALLFSPDELPIQKQGALYFQFFDPRYPFGLAFVDAACVWYGHYSSIDCRRVWFACHCG